jgi:UDP-N-acetylmuramate dehydrogenase
MAVYTIEKQVSLAPMNTLRVAARASRFVRLTDTEALGELLSGEGPADQPVLVLGEGSNILFAGDYPGLVVQLAFTTIVPISDDGDGVGLRVAAGIGWDALVDWTLAHGLKGLENLALIPGLAGAAPIQNIGAYGVEIREFITAVTAWDRHRSCVRRLSNAECEFDYRDSRFKREIDRWIVTSIDLALPRRRELRLDYAGVREELTALGIARPTARDVAAAVRRLRRRKLPDPAVIGNAGSFFKNPIVPRQVYEELQASHAAVPHYPVAAPERVKLSAAWLIEACGLKGYREGDAGISAQHALVLVNHGQATGAQLLALARRVIGTVAEHFDVVLEPEPRIVGADLNP